MKIILFKKSFYFEHCLIKCSLIVCTNVENAQKTAFYNTLNTILAQVESASSIPTFSSVSELVLLNVNVYSIYMLHIRMNDH